MPPKRRNTKRLRLRRKVRRSYRTRRGQRGGAGSAALLRGYPMLVTAKPPGDPDDPDRVPTVMRSTTFEEESDGNPDQPSPTA